MAGLIVFGCIASLIVGIIHLCQGTIHSPLLISLLWCVYNMVPQVLLIWYAFMPHSGRWKRTFNWMCKLGMLVQWVTAVAAVIMIWLMLPPVYDSSEPLEDSFYFYQSQLSGIMPSNIDVEWRGESHLQDAVAQACDVGLVFAREQTRDMYSRYEMTVGPGFANLTQCAYQVRAHGKGSVGGIRGARDGGGARIVGRDAQVTPASTTRR